MQAQRNEINFEGQNIYAGIDVHRKSWTVCIMTEDIEYKKFMQPPNGKALHSYLTRNFPCATYHSAYESGFSGFWAHRQLEDLGIHSMVTNAADVPTKQKERMQKDDLRDSRKIALSLRSRQLDAIYVPLVATQEDRYLLRVRSSLVRDMTKNKNRIKATLYYFGIPYPERFENKSSHWSKNFLLWLKEVQFSQTSGRQALDNLIRAVEDQRKLLLSVTRQIKQLAETEKYASDVKLLKTVPGIGLVMAMHFLTEIEDINRFKNTDHFASYVGIVPDCHDSGEVKKNGKISFRGQPLLKKGIVESSWTAIRNDRALARAYKTYISRMDGNKAIIRIARKLLNRIYFVLKNKKEYVVNVVK